MSEFMTRFNESKHIFNELFVACGYTFMLGCGSYLFDGQNYEYCPLMDKKQELLYHQVKTATNVLEVGTYMGHSLLIMLLSNPTVKITCIDIDDRFTRPSVEVLNKYFNNRVTFIHSDSLSALSGLNDTFDFFHIDGLHDNEYIEKEFKLIQKLNRGHLFRVIFDDQECLTKLQEHIHENYTVKENIVPECLWSSVYFEIQLE